MKYQIEITVPDVSESEFLDIEHALGQLKILDNTLVYNPEKRTLFVIYDRFGKDEPTTYTSCLLDTMAAIRKANPAFLKDLK